MSKYTDDQVQEIVEYAKLYVQIGFLDEKELSQKECRELMMELGRDKRYVMSILIMVAKEVMDINQNIPFSNYITAIHGGSPASIRKHATKCGNVVFQYADLATALYNYNKGLRKAELQFQ